MSRAWKKPPTHLPGYDYERMGRPQNPSLKILKRIRRRHTNSRTKKPWAGLQFKVIHHHLSPPTKPDIERLLTVFSSPLSSALFRRTKGVWKCVSADPMIDWMIRVKHLDKISDWLRLQRLSYHWHKATPAVRSAIQPRTEDKPAEAYPASKPSAPSGDNTNTSLNNATLNTP